jgi:Cu/Ag efflux pump CusA
MDVENVTRCLRENRDAGSPESTTRVLMRAVLETRGSVLYGTLMLLLAVAPILWMGGTAEPFFRPLAVSYALALLASMVVGWTVTPALCMILLSNASLERRSSPLVVGLQRMYDAILSGMVRQGRAAVVVTILLAVAAVMITPRLHRSVLPVFHERNLVIDLRALPGTSLPEMTRIGGAVRRELQSTPGVRDVSAHIGRAVLGDQAVDVHSAQMWVTMDPAGTTTRRRPRSSTWWTAIPGSTTGSRPTCARRAKTWCRALRTRSSPACTARPRPACASTPSRCARRSAR